MKPIRTQSKDPVVKDAARQGVKLYAFSGGYWTASAKQMAREARVTETFMRRWCWMFSAGCGLTEDVLAKRLTEQKAYRLARLVIDEVRPACAPDDTDEYIRRIAEMRMAADAGKATENHQFGENQQRSIEEELAEAVAEIRRLRAMLFDVGVDPDS